MESSITEMLLADFDSGVGMATSFCRFKECCGACFLAPRFPRKNPADFWLFTIKGVRCQAKTGFRRAWPRPFHAGEKLILKSVRKCLFSISQKSAA